MYYIIVITIYLKNCCNYLQFINRTNIKSVSVCVHPPNEDNSDFT